MALIAAHLNAGVMGWRWEGGGGAWVRACVRVCFSVSVCVKTE